MFPTITWKHVRNIDFPAYKLPIDDVTYYEGVTYCEGKVVDDRNMPGDTIGKRRLHVKKPLYPLRFSAFSFMDILKAVHCHFITNKGIVFSYKKTKYCRVLSVRIKEIITKDTYSIVKLQGIQSSFICNSPPSPEFIWASVIYVGEFPWDITDFYRYKQLELRRKI